MKIMLASKFVAWIKKVFGKIDVDSNDNVVIDGKKPLYNTATGVDSLTITGNASGSARSINIGLNSTASNTQCTAIGISSTATGYNSIAIGHSSNSSNGAALGASSQSVHEYSVALGNLSRTGINGDICHAYTSQNYKTQQGHFLFAYQNVAITIPESGSNATRRYGIAIDLSDGSITSITFGTAFTPSHDSLILFTDAK